MLQWKHPGPGRPPPPPVVAATGSGACPRASGITFYSAMKVAIMKILNWSSCCLAVLYGMGLGLIWLQRWQFSVCFEASLEEGKSGSKAQDFSPQK